MSLTQKVNEEMKSAMKDGNKFRLEMLRMIRASIIEYEKSGAKQAMTPEIEISLLNSLIKKKKEAIEDYAKGGLEERVQFEKNELAILMEFMPKQMTDEEVEEVVKRIASELGAAAKDGFSKLMPACMKELKGKADGNLVRALVQKTLGMS